MTKNAHPKLLALSGTDQSSMPLYPTTGYPQEYIDYNPSIDDFLGNEMLGWGIKMPRIRIPKPRIPSSITSMKNRMSDMASKVKNQMQAQMDAMRKQLQAQMANAKKLAEEQTKRMAEQVKKQAYDRLAEQTDKLKSKVKSVKDRVMSDPRYINFAIMGVTTALGQPALGATLVALKTAYEQKMSQAELMDQAAAMGVPEEDLTYLQDAYKIMEKEMMAQADKIQKEALQLQEMIPGASIPDDAIIKIPPPPAGDIVVRSGVPAYQPTIQKKKTDKKTMMYVGIGATVLLVGGMAFMLMKKK